MITAIICILMLIEISMKNKHQARTQSYIDQQRYKQPRDGRYQTRFKRSI